MKKFTKGTIALMLALTLFAGAAWAWDQTDHVTMAPNGQGDMMIFPLWAADLGYQTNFTITNTSDTMSTVAKVVLRSQVYTQELLDFFIFLSPNDVFKARIYRDGNSVYLESNDDSVVARIGANNTPVWASDNNTPSNPGDDTLFSVELTAPTCESLPTVGYIEVFEAAFRGYAKNSNGVVPKNTILCGYGGGLNGLRDNQVLLPGTGLLGLADLSGGIASHCGTAQNPFTQARAMYVGTLNILAGQMEIEHLTNGRSAGVRATVFRNFGSSYTQKLTIQDITQFNFSALHNSAAETEAVLSKNSLHMPYTSSNLSYHVFTFPTKGTTVRNIPSLNPSCRATGWVGPFFNNVLTPASIVANRPVGDNGVDYTASIYDMKENTQQGTGFIISPLPPGPATSQFPNEVNIINPPNFPYPEGWVRYVLEGGSAPTTAFTQAGLQNNPSSANRQDIRYSGVPVIGTLIDFGGDSGPAMIEASWRDTLVEVEDAPNVFTPYLYYQYFDYAHNPNQPETNAGFRTDTTLPPTPTNLTSWPFPAVPTTTPLTMEPQP